MNLDSDMDGWRRLWHARPDSVVAADLQDRVARETRRRAVWMIAPVFVTVAIGGWITARAFGAPELDNIVLAVETWLYIALIWAGSLWIDRGTWRPLANTTAAFVEISIRRCSSTVSGLRFGALMYVVQFLFIVWWKRHYSGLQWSDLLTAWPVILIGWVGGPVFLAFVAWYSGRKRAELQQLIGLRRQLGEG